MRGIDGGRTGTDYLTRSTLGEVGEFFETTRFRIGDGTGRYSLVPSPVCDGTGQKRPVPSTPKPFPKV